MTTETVRSLHVTVIEDHQLIAHSLSLALRSAGITTDVPQLTSAKETLALICADAPDVALLDLQLGGQIGDGGALIAPLTERGIRVLVMTAVTDPHRLAAGLESGAVGFIGKSEPFEVLIDAVRRAANGERVIPEHLQQQMMINLRRHRALEWNRVSLFQHLTQREQQVLGALCDGLTVEAIAAQWTVSTATVRSQVRAVLTKLNVNSQLTAVALARKSGWTLPD
jgi:DNA-binding NarL/FixJ family response regulator